MALFRDEANILTMENACPICHSDVKGNDIYLYFCQNCNVLFRKEDLVLDKKRVENLLKQKVAEKFEQDKDKLKMDDGLIKDKGLSDKKKAILKEFKETKKYYISKKSNIIHVSNCPYGKNIKKENKRTLRSLKGTERLKRCRCMSD